MKKYLGDLLKDVKFTGNNLILSPTGSGKTYFILDNLVFKYTRVLYLCDTTNLRLQTENDSYDEDVNFYFVDAMCYQNFGKKVKRDNSFISNYDCIVCDEFHNIFNYEKSFNDVNMSHAIKELIKHYDKTDIYYLTATPYYLFKEKQFFSNIDKYMTTYDFLDNEEINKYINDSESKLSHYKNIYDEINNMKDYIKENKLKILIYTNKITTMNIIKNKLKDIDNYFNPICLWSLNSQTSKMDEEQIDSLNFLLMNSKLPDQYNVLIINSSMETGINIKDSNFQLCFINSNNKTTQVQVRGRIRHDIFKMYTINNNEYKENKNEDKVSNTIEQYIGRNLTKQIKDELCTKIGMYDAKGRIVKWPRIKQIIRTLDYNIEDKRIRIKDKIVNISIISKK